MNYIKISDLPIISLEEINGTEDIIITKDVNSKKLKLNTLYDYITNDIIINIDDKVDKIPGKGLSTEDFSTEEKAKLENIADNANNYELPVANTNTLGGIKNGNFIDISEDGIASVSENVQVLWQNIQSRPNFYSTSEIDTLLDAKADLDSPDLLGTPTVPTASTNSNNTTIANTQFVNNLIADKSSSLNIPNTIVQRDASGNFIVNSITGNISTSTALSSPRLFALTGDVSGSVSTNLLNGMSINCSVQDDSHSHSISTLTGLQTLLDNKIETNLLGVANGVATLDSTGKIYSINLPSFVDDIIEYADLYSFPTIGETGKIYLALDTNKTYRWSGSVYVYITSGAVDSVNSYTGVVNLTKGDVGLSNVDNTSDATKVVLSSSKLSSTKTFSITGDISGSTTSDLSGGLSIATTLPSTGVTAGTYKSVTVNSKGLITDGTNPTTLLGFGINDAYTKTEVQTLLPKVGFDTTATPTLGLGQFGWNSTESTLDLECGGATLQLGQEQLVRVRNTSGSTILNGYAVMATGTIGNSSRITASPANISTNTAKLIVGICTEDITSNSDGFVTTFGKIRSIQTNGANYGETWVDGDILYVKDMGSGALTKIVPNDTQLKMPIAIVIHSHPTNGTIFVRVNSIDENHAKAELALKAPLDNPTFTGTITGNLDGNASTATKLETARNINGVAFDGTSNISINTINSEIIKFDTGTTEGTDLYTFNGSSTKTIDIKAGTNVSLTKTAGSITINANDTSIAITEITGLGTGVSTFLSTPTSANLRTTITDETGTGNLVFSTSPTLITPNIGVASGTSFNSITALSSTTPIIAGTAAVGTSTTVARADHIHPVQTSVSGNAGTATKLATARNINGVAFNGTSDIITDETILSTEYNARKIRNSKTVYGIEVDLGTLPNTNFKNVAFTFNSSYTYWIDGTNSYSASSNEVITIPYNGYIGDGVSVKLDKTNNNIVIITEKDRTNFTSTKLVLNYTK